MGSVGGAQQSGRARDGRFDPTVAIGERKWRAERVSSGGVRANERKRRVATGNRSDCRSPVRRVCDRRKPFGRGSELVERRRSRDRRGRDEYRRRIPGERRGGGGLRGG